MKFSTILHGVSAVTGVAGLLALVAAWVSGAMAGDFWGFSQAQQHLYFDAITLILLSIASGIGTLVHFKEEKGK